MMDSVLLVLVLTEPLRSAEPPINSGIALVSASSASPEALRDAHDGLSAATLLL